MTRCSRAHRMKAGLAGLAGLALVGGLLSAPAASAQSAQSSQLGRLFASPAERLALEHQRDASQTAAQTAGMPGAGAGAGTNTNSSTGADAIPPGYRDGAQRELPPPGMALPDMAAPGMHAPAAAPAPAPAPNSTVELSGVLRSSRGRSTVWINQQALPQQIQPQSSHVLTDQRTALRLSSGRQLLLKPGQRFDPALGSVQDLGR